MAALIFYCQNTAKPSKTCKNHISINDENPVFSRLTELAPFGNMRHFRFGTQRSWVRIPSHRSLAGAPLILYL